MRLSILILVLVTCSLQLSAQELMISHEDQVPLKTLQRKMDSLQMIKMPKNGPARKTTASNFDTAAFNANINSNWGPGLSTAQKLEVFNTYWGQVDSFYASFTGLPMYNWDSIINQMRTEIAAGVSKGRFAGILGQLDALINDGHSYIRDNEIFSTGSMSWGQPLFYGKSSSSGACVTMLDDSSALVYNALPGNGLGLSAGDIILGYNGIPWKEIVPILLHYQLPTGSNRYSTDSATWHRYICSVLNNFLIFDTLNIEKCDGTLVNIPTSAMPGTLSGTNFCTEQLQVPGVQKMGYNDFFTNGKMVTSGVITGTGIGYVALYDCGDISGDSLLIPVKRLVEDSLVDGLIIDIRTNFGGSLLTYRNTFHYLNDGDFPWMGWANRVDPTDRYTMNPLATPPSGYGTTDTDPHFFDKKIALLVGPGAISAGDVMQILFTHHPKLKIIGKPTAGAFGAIVSVPLPYPNFSGARQTGDFYRAEENDFYLSHHNFPIDSFVWFDRASVCNGIDNILETAIDWIKPELAVKDLSNGQTTATIYPNPTRGNFNILFQSPVTTTITITLYNALGLEATQITTSVTAGENRLQAYFANKYLPTGSYQIAIRGNGLETIVKKVVIID